MGREGWNSIAPYCSSASLFLRPKPSPAQIASGITRGDAGSDPCWGWFGSGAETTLVLVPSSWLLYAMCLVCATREVWIPVHKQTMTGCIFWMADQVGFFPPQITDYFSYEHFYVIYCKFWELDSDHDLLIDAQDLSRHADHGKHVIISSVVI